MLLRTGCATSRLGEHAIGGNALGELVLCEFAVDIFALGILAVGVMAKNEDTAQVIGERVRARRAELGLSQEKVALASGVHWTVISQVERGTRNLSIPTLIKLAQGLQIDPGELLRGLTPPPE